MYVVQSYYIPLNSAISLEVTVRLSHLLTLISLPICLAACSGPKEEAVPAPVGATIDNKDPRAVNAPQQAGVGPEANTIPGGDPRFNGMPQKGGKKK